MKNRETQYVHNSRTKYMEKRRRTNTGDSSSVSLKEAIASLNPLLQPFDDETSDSETCSGQLPVFQIVHTDTSENSNGNIDFSKNQNNIFRKYCCYLQRFSGIIYALLASLLFTCSNFIIQKLDVILLDVFLVRFFFQGILSLGFIVYKGYHPFSNCNGLLVFIRSVIAATGSVCFYLGLAFLPLPDLMTLRYTQVVWTALLALIIFRERITFPIVIASTLTLIGVIGVAQPSFLFTNSTIINGTSQATLTNNDDKRALGMFVALLCAFSISMGIVLNKKLIERKVRQSIILFHFILTTFMMLLIIQTYHWTLSKTNQQKFNIKQVYLTKNFIYATILATLQLIPMVLSQKSIKREHPSVFTIVQASDIVFAIILHNVFSKVKSNGFVLLSSALVLTSIIIVGTHKLWQDRKHATHLPISIDETE
ncbi:unnamed protein product [Rotaria socialis]|uniref:EamA domain-containing protein n=2 Tax=Rotaria socialis TaxID=392032 RepID=A0A818IRR8_9BILA|nr:unnamed protein product [Rotaria socialis]